MTDATPALKIFREAPSRAGLRTAALGRIACDSPEAGLAAIDAALSQLRAEGYQAVIAPMEGDTWHAYRYVIESDGSPPFLMEPPRDDTALAALRMAGFDIVATYASSRAALEPVAEPARMDGVSVSAWDGSDPERFLADVYELSREAFSRNPFYKELDRAGFDALYRPLVPMLDRRLVLFARDEADGLLGFVFGFPQPGRAGSCVLKTYASRRRGVGRVLLDAFHDTAARHGFTDVVHALMHEGNESLDRSGRQGGAVFRRYALLGRTL